MTRSDAGTLVWWPSRRVSTSDGSMPLMDDMTREVEKSCHALNAAWSRSTIRSTTASAKLDA